MCPEWWHQQTHHKSMAIQSISKREIRFVGIMLLMDHGSGYSNLATHFLKAFEGLEASRAILGIWLPKPHAIAIEQWLQEKIYYRHTDARRCRQNMHRQREVLCGLSTPINFLAIPCNCSTLLRLPHNTPPYILVSTAFLSSGCINLDCVGRPTWCFATRFCDKRTGDFIGKISNWFKRHGFSVKYIFLFFLTNSPRLYY